MEKNIAGKYSTRKLKEFYLGKGENPWGRTLGDIRSDVTDLSSKEWKPGEKREQLFDECIQWMFPLYTGGTRLVFSPSLSMRQVKRLKREYLVKANMLKSLKYVLKNYGLILQVTDEDTVVIHYSPTGGQTRFACCVVEDEMNSSVICRQERKLHYERMYRILKSLHLFGLNEFANALKNALKDGMFVNDVI